MRLFSKLAIGGGALSAVTAGALVVGGVFATSATLVAVDPAAPPAGADTLRSFDNCAALRDWYVAHSISDVGPYGWGGPILMYKSLSAQRAPMALTDAAANLSSGTLDSRASSSTGTNTQEADVDEPDVAKTDGKLLVRLTPPRRGGTDQMLAVSDVTGAEKNTLGRLHLPQASYDSQLLLVGDHVVVTQSVSGYGNPIAYDRMWGAPRAAAAETRVLSIDVSDPFHPSLERTEVYSGSLVSARQYGDTVRLVTDTGRPELDWLLPAKGVSTKVATAHNKRLVRESSIEDWLPSLGHGSAKERVVECRDVLRPKDYSGTDTITVTTFDAASPEDRSSVAVTASGGVVYSSADRLYVASTAWQGPVALGRRVVAPEQAKTDLHAFALDGPRTAYVGSGHVEGTVRDRWSLDEYDGNLRVAWSNRDRDGRTENGVSVLAERDGRLVEVGTQGSLGINEDIQSVRWFDDLAVVVTFRQMDPLYTIDLSDPKHPRMLGKLKIPGYSGYLHPIGNDLLLGLGIDGGFGSGAQAAVFDISDLRHPVRVDKVGFGSGSYLQALDDPRAFTWLPGRRVGLTPVTRWGELRGRGRLVVQSLKVGEDGTMSASTVAELTEGWQPRILPLEDDRVAIVDGDRVQLVSP